MRVWPVIAVCLACLPVAPLAAQEAPQPGTYPVTLPPRTFQAVVAYLKRQPWEDVQPLMAALAEAAQASAPQPASPRKPAPPVDSGQK